MKVTNKPLVSVIVVAYQSSKFILETLESIKAQSWENIELILSDDGSTDETVSIGLKWLNENQSRFVNTRFLTVAQNTGIPANCMRGFEATQGEWIKFIGADDILLENCIADNMKVVQQKKDITFVISNLVEIDESGRIIRVSPENTGLNYFMQNQGSKKEQLKAYARWPAFLNTPTFFYKRELLIDSFKSDYNIKIFEDTSVIFSIINKGARIFYLKKPTVKYRIHNNAISRSEKFETKRERESYLIYRHYRRKYLSPFNPIDLAVFYENWLRFKYKGIKGHKGISVLKKLSLFYWHLKLNGIRNENRQKIIEQ